MINVKLHIKAPEYFTLDSTPLVGPNPEFCWEIGYTDGRQFCPVRLEQDSERRACEAWVMGNAKDTGKPGPTWMREWETYCTTFAESGCEHNPDNPFSLFIQTGGWYQACRGDRHLRRGGSRPLTSCSPALQSWAGEVRFGIPGAGDAGAGRSEL